MTSHNVAFTTYITYEGGVPSKWKRLTKKNAQAAQNHQITPAAAVNRIANQPSMCPIFKWKTKNIKVKVPTSIRRDEVYSSDRNVLEVSI